MEKTPSYLLENKKNILDKEDVNFKIFSDFYKKYEEYPIIKEILENCPEKTINREKVLDYFNNNQLLHGFLAAMIWGSISTGGVSGDNFSKILSVNHSEILTIIEKVKDYITNNRFKDAYIFMETEGKLKGLGDSFFTKLFFFIGESNKQEIIPPIYDKWTKIAFCALLIENNEEDLLKKYFSSVKDIRLRTNKNEGYNEFVYKMNYWSKELNLPTSKLEQFIFGNHKGKDKSNKNPRRVFENIIANYVKE